MTVTLPLLNREISVRKLAGGLMYVLTKGQLYGSLTTLRLAQLLHTKNETEIKNLDGLEATASISSLDNTSGEQVSVSFASRVNSTASPQPKPDQAGQ